MGVKFVIYALYSDFINDDFLLSMKGSFSSIYELISVASALHCTALHVLLDRNWFISSIDLSQTFDKYGFIVELITLFISNLKIFFSLIF